MSQEFRDDGKLLDEKERATKNELSEVSILWTILTCTLISPWIFSASSEIGPTSLNYVRKAEQKGVSCLPGKLTYINNYEGKGRAASVTLVRRRNKA